MRNIKLTIEYDGTNYRGWQVQNGQRIPGKRKRPSIQEVIEQTLQKIIQEKIRLIGSGRTDSGVHAKGQIANFKTGSNIKLEKLQKALNSLLPGDISILRTEEADICFHSRFDAQSKVYHYCILNRKIPSAFTRNTVYFYPYPLNVRLMNKEARSLLGRHNFKAFQASCGIINNSHRTIKEIKITKYKDLITIVLEADGFLRNMARNIVGTLIEIGRGRFPEGSLKRILVCRDRNLAGPTAPAKGLCLMKVKYK